MDEILSATASLVREKGYAMTSIDEIADCLDLAKASIYHYFDSKEALVYATLEACHREVTGRLRAIATGDGSALERLRLLIATQIRLSTVEMPAAVGLFLRPFDWPPNVAVAVTEWRAENDDIFRSVIDQGVKTGEFSLAQPALSRLCMQGALAFVPDWYQRNSKDQGRAVVDTLMRLFVAS